MQVSRKKNKLEYKAIDGVLRTTQENGEKVSVSMKCAELDRQIPDHLGVSAAVLENVVFVHQEDSDWPMLDGGTVKKRFDEIFDSTRYSKALEAITKAKKEKLSSAKDLKGEMLELGAHLTAVKQSRRELEDCIANQGLCTEALDAVTEKLARNKERVNKSINSFQINCSYSD
jgi:DNA repair protein RAD50